MKYQGLGRGLDSLIPSKIEQEKSADSIVRREENSGAGKKEISEVPTSSIRPNPQQPRHEFNHDDLEDLINSIREHGIIQPLVVRREGGNFQLIAGERRFRAAQMLSLEKVPVVIRQVEKDQDLLELALIENIQRKDLNPLEKALGYRHLLEEFQLTQEEAAKKIGKKRATLANALRLLELPEEIQRALAEEKITEGHAKAILALDGADRQLNLFHRILTNKFSVREAENQVKRTKGSKIFPLDKDADTREKEERLREALGTKVDINKRGRQGRITVEFYSAEELRNIVDKICS